MRSDSTSTLCTTILFIIGHVPVLFYILVQRARITCFRCRCVRCLRHFVCLARMCYFQLFLNTMQHFLLAGQDRAWYGRARLGCAGLGWAVLCLAWLGRAVRLLGIHNLAHMSHVTS